MPSPFHGIDLARRALTSFQRGLDTTGHNIANVNTPGYSRQSVNFTEVEPTLFFGMNPIALGNGVGITSISRVVDDFQILRLQNAQADLGQFTARSEGAKQLEQILPEPGGNGISDALNQFFNSWSALASNPNDSGLKVQVQLSGQTLTQRVRASYGDLQTLQEQNVAQIEQTLKDVDSLSEKIAGLNTQIREKSFFGAVPNDLLDQRDQAVKDLGNLVDITTQKFSDGSVAVYMNQLTLVDSGGARTFPTNYDPVAKTVTDGNGTYDVQGGKLAGYFDNYNSVTGYQTQLDDLANNLRTTVNTLHQTGVNSLGNTGVDFFNDSAPQTGALDFDLSAAVLADPQAISTGTSGEAGDGTLALSLSRARDASVGALGSRTFSKFFSDMVGSIGRESAYYQSSLSTQENVITQIQNQIQAVSGVSLDEEMANMMKFQRSYQAAARALTMFDQMTEELINLIR